MKSIKNLALIPVLIACLFIGVPEASALTISPVKIEVSGDPGQTLRGELELLNEQAQPKTFFSSFENFEPSGDTGSPKFVGSEDGLATWLGTQASVAVATGETIKVPYTITIPASAEAGGYFAAIFWGEQDPTTQEAGEVSIGGKLGVLILLRVNGDIAEEAGITEFATTEGNLFQFGLPVNFTYKFSNSGGDRVVPIGDIVIKNTFGGTAATISANVNEGSVLPGSARRFQAVWGEVDSAAATSTGFFGEARKQMTDFHFGLYKAELSVVYGATNQLAADSVRIVMFPWQLLTLVFSGLLLAYFLLRRYNSWIISKSKSNA